jgi:hypothetical protein
VGQAWRRNGAQPGRLGAAGPSGYPPPSVFGEKAMFGGDLSLKRIFICFVQNHVVGLDLKHTRFNLYRVFQFLVVVVGSLLKVVGRVCLKLCFLVVLFISLFQRRVF